MQATHEHRIWQGLAKASTKVLATPNGSGSDVDQRVDRLLHFGDAIIGDPHGLRAVGRRAAVAIAAVEQDKFRHVSRGCGARRGLRPKRGFAQ